MRHLGWSAIVLAAVAALGLALAWGAFFGFSIGAVSSIESNSMSHAEEPLPGVLDPGEWRQLEPVHDRDAVRTFYQGKTEGYAVGQDHGDVIAYHPVVRGEQIEGEDDPSPLPGLQDRGTLIEHRAIAWVVYNETSDAYDVPETGVYGQRVFTLPGVGTYDPSTESYVHRALEVQLHPDVAGRHDGYLTRGDHNQGADQDARGQLQDLGTPELVAVDTIEGRVVGHVDTTWITAIQLGVPVAALAAAGLVYAWRRGHLDPLLPDVSLGAARCPACGTRYEDDETFCHGCGEDRTDPT